MIDSYPEIGKLYRITDTKDAHLGGKRYPGIECYKRIGPSKIIAGAEILQLRLINPGEIILWLGTDVHTIDLKYSCI